MTNPAGETNDGVLCVQRGLACFSRSQSCRDKSQSPVVWIAEERETELSKPIDKASLGRTSVKGKAGW